MVQQSGEGDSTGKDNDGLKSMLLAPQACMRYRRPLTDIRELLVVSKDLRGPGKVLAVQGHQEQRHTHDLQ
jgi:hypothetical protein